ncbi:MAG TPA: hypothetical protein PK357_00750 [Candidatus Pacearchaeota archaeon]|nr:hypothetical protein [Candidatus Pacearchaeota archaeon]
MPTRESLNDSWYAQFELGLSDEAYYCQDHNPDYVASKNNPIKPSGERLGDVVYDSETGRLTIESKVKKD